MPHFILPANSHLLSSQDIQTLSFLLPLARKAGGRCGFAESMPEERITALKMDETAVEMTDVVDGAKDIVQKVEAPRQKYPFFWSEPQTNVTKTRFLVYLSERAACFTAGEHENLRQERSDGFTTSPVQTD